MPRSCLEENHAVDEPLGLRDLALPQLDLEQGGQCRLDVRMTFGPQRHEPIGVAGAPMRSQQPRHVRAELQVRAALVEGQQGRVLILEPVLPPEGLRDHPAEEEVVRFGEPEAGQLRDVRPLVRRVPVHGEDPRTRGISLGVDRDPVDSWRWGLARRGVGRFHDGLRLAIVLLLVCVGVPAKAAADGLSRVKAAGELRWGGDLQGGEPFVFRDAAHPERIVGFEVELADAIARELGVRARFVQADWTQLLASLDRADFDVAMNGLEDMPARRARYLLSRPYFRLGETLVVRQADVGRYRSLADLRGKPVGTLGATLAEALIRQGGCVLRRYEGTLEAYLDLEHGRSEGVLMDHVIAERYARSRPALSFVPGDVASGTYVIAYRRGDDSLARAVDEALGRIDASGERRRILERWKLWDARQEGPDAVGGGVGAAVGRGALEQGPSQPHGIGWGHVQLFLRGASYTLVISVLSFLPIAIPLGLGLALARLYGSRPLRFVASAYVEVFRGTPALLQLYVLYHAFAPVIRLDALSAAILGLGLNYAAYEAEVYRAAITAVPAGQSQAALAIGLSRAQLLRFVVLPQAARVALPAMTNDFIALLKDTSLVSVITVVELTKQMTITAPDVRDWVGPGLLCAALYFAMSYPLSRLSGWLEGRLHAAGPRAA